jgi:hypothetical protein
MHQRRTDGDGKTYQRAAQRQRRRLVALADQQHFVERRHPRVGFEEHRQQHGGQQQVDQIV